MPGLSELIGRYKADPESAYNVWFVGSEARMKAFRAIRRGVRDTVDSIATGTFGTDFKGSPLEVVLTAITEQQEVFEGAAHPFFWKPKLRIPDISPPSHDRAALQHGHRARQHSKDLGAFAGLLYEIGIGRLLVTGNADAVLAAERAKAERAARVRHAQVLAEQAETAEHTQIQYLLIKIGRALGYDVHVARNDRHRSYEGQAFTLLTTPELPATGWPPEVMETVRLIDVIWLRPDTREIVSAFEVEKSTSIYSGILRLEDLARSIPGCTCNFYLVAPAPREKEVMAQLARPAFRDDLSDISLAFISFDELCRECDALCKYGEDHSILSKIARRPHLALGGSKP